MDVVIWTFPNSPLRNMTRELNHNHNSDQNRRCYSFQSVNESLKLPKKNWGGVSVFLLFLPVIKRMTYSGSYSVGS